MAALTGSSIASTYTELLKITSASLGADASAKYIEDGAGTASALSISTSRVGIGTATPDTLLDVEGTGTVISTVTSTDGGAIVRIKSNSSTESALQFSDESDNNIGQISFDHTDNHMALRVNDATRMTIDSSGNVGIGETTPVAKMHISTADSGVTPSTSADELLIENAGYAGITIASSSTTSGNIFFADSADSGRGQITYKQGDDYMAFATSGTEAVRITSDGGIYEKGGVLKENLLTNSGFDVWSNSGGLFTTGGTVPVNNDGFSHDTETCDDDADDDETGDWNSTGSGLAHNASDYYEFSTNGTTQRMRTNSAYTALTAGKLYKYSVEAKTGSGGAVACFIRVLTTGGSVVHIGSSFTTTGSFVEHSIVFEAVGTEQKNGFVVSPSMSGSNVQVRKFMLHEVTPGCVASDALAMDGWGKSGDFDIFRQHNDGGTLTKDGSFYALKVVNTGTSDQVYWPSSASSTQGEFLQRFSGRTVTMGMWALTDDANFIRCAVYDGSTVTSSSYHTGTDDTWEWLEVTATMQANTTQFQAYVCRSNAATGTGWISQPILVFGSSIGEGNYTKPQGEIVWCEDPPTSIVLTGSGHSDVADSGVNLEADTLGKMPKGAKAIWVNMGFRDSGSAASSAYLGVQGIGDFLDISISGQANDSYGYSNQSFPLDSSGDYDYRIEASGSATFDIDHFKIYAVQLR